MRRLLILVSALAGPASVAAQLPQSARVEVRSLAGVYAPLGAQSKDFSPADVYAIQTALELHHRLHFVASLSMVNGRSKIDAMTDDVAYIWPHDLGVEFVVARRSASNKRLRPFVGAGYGARAYEFPDAGVAYTLCASSYGALGASWEKRVIAVRLESRGYFSCFKSPVMSERSPRTDVMLLLGLTYHLN
jgi:hypothetical protein